MKNILIYYSAILVPIPLLIWVAKFENSFWFAVLLLIYSLPYRALVDGMRLVNKKMIKWNEVWKLLIPGKRMEYTRELYLEK